MSSPPCWITPALTERRERFEFASGVDGKTGEANHPRNEPTPPRDVASVQRFVIQTANHPGSNILANQPIEVEHDPGMARAPCPHGGFAESTGRFVNSATECMLPHFSTLIEHWPSAFEHHRICAERVRAWPSATLHQPSMTDLSLYNARVNRGVEKCSVSENGVGYNGSEASIRRLANPTA